MKHLQIALTLAIFSHMFIGAPVYAVAQRLFTGTIQFPKQIAQVPGVRVYHAGRKITTTTNDNAKSVSFSLPETKTIFYLVISPQIEFVSEENIVKYLTLHSKVPVKFFVLELLAQDIAGGSNQFRLASIDKTHTSPWHIKEITPPTSNARIPDDAIIVCLDPAWVDRIEGNTAYDIKAIIKNDIISQVGSEAKLHEVAAQWLLAALNTDTIHGSIDQEICTTSQPKTVVAFNW